MKVMILAAGRGERMRPLTDVTPKPLLQVAGKALIEHHLLRLADAGFSDIVINQGWLGEQLPEVLGDGRQYGVHIQYSPELDGALETGGGLHRALPLLTNDAQSQFLVVNGDVWCDVDYAKVASSAPHASLAHLVLVDNPPHNVDGDFALAAQGQLVEDEALSAFTYSGVGVFHRDLFSNCCAGKFPLAPLLRQAIKQSAVTGLHHAGQWFDIGTPERLQQLNNLLT